MTLVKSADLYSLQLLARERKTQVPTDLIDIILTDNRISGFTVDGGMYRPHEIAMLKSTGLFRRVGEQIVLATYTAAEMYLTEKFKEYLAFRYSQSSPELLQALLDRLSFRSLQEIKKHYSDLLDIHLPFFEIQMFTTDKCNFQPRDCWEAFNILSTARNDIAHLGYSKAYKVDTPVDSWYPFEFVRTWIAQFDSNFDMLMFARQETSLIVEYKQRANASHCK